MSAFKSSSPAALAAATVLLAVSAGFQGKDKQLCSCAYVTVLNVIKSYHGLEKINELKILGIVQNKLHICF